jgi:hypothetical protein
LLRRTGRRGDQCYTLFLIWIEGIAKLCPEGIAYPPSAFLVDWKSCHYFVAGSGRQL